MPTESSQLKGSRQKPELWSDLREKFESLADSELKLDRGNERDRWLRAYAYAGDGENAGRVLYHVSTGLDERFRDAFIRNAKAAGLALKPGCGREALDLWLSYVFADSRKNKSQLLRVHGGETGIVIRVCEASALCCSRLEQSASEISPIRDKAEKAAGKRRNAANHVTPQAQISNAEARGLRRARLVRKLLNELNALKSQMQIPEDDFPDLAKKNPTYEVFKICSQNPSASVWVKRLPDRRTVHPIAFELAAIACGCRAATIQTAWKLFKKRASH